MTAKEYLSQIGRLDAMIDMKIKEKEALMNLDGVYGLSYDREKVCASKSCDAPFVHIAEKIERCEEEITAMIDLFVDIKAKIIKQIQALPKVEYMQLLYKRYVEYKCLDTIAEEMCYSHDWALHTHKKALDAFAAYWRDKKYEEQQIQIVLYRPESLLKKA